MNEKAVSKHDFDTSLILIRMTSETMESGIEDMLDYIEANQVYDVVNQDKMRILRKSVKSLLLHVAKLEAASSKVLFSDNEEKS